jgi:hypothetical protein
MTTPAPDLTPVLAASELIAFGLARAHRPVDGSEYRTLLDRYRTDLRFKDTVDTIAQGLGLTVLALPGAGSSSCRSRMARSPRGWPTSSPA